MIALNTSSLAASTATSISSASSPSHASAAPSANDSDASYEDVAAADNGQAAIALARASNKASAAHDASASASAKKHKPGASDVAARVGHAVAGTVDAISAVAAASHMDLLGTVASAMHAAGNIASALTSAGDTTTQASARESGIGALLSSSLPPSARLTSATVAASLGTSASADAQALSKNNAGAHSILAALQSHLEKAAPVAAKGESSTSSQEQHHQRDGERDGDAGHARPSTRSDDVGAQGGTHGDVHAGDARAAFGASESTVATSTIDGPALAQDPRASAAASAAEAILMDPALRAAVMPHSAQISLTTEQGLLTVSLHAKNGITDVTMTGAAAPQLEAHKHELVQALASEGMSLGSFDTKSGGHGAEHDPQQQQQDDDVRAAAAASTSSNNPHQSAVTHAARNLRGIVA